jgi:hypothetical protein
MKISEGMTRDVELIDPNRTTRDAAMGMRDRGVVQPSVDERQAKRGLG